VFKRSSFARPVQMVWDKVNQMVLLLSKKVFSFITKATERRIEAYKTKDLKKV
jgi:hypothetical protein